MYDSEIPFVFLSAKIPTVLRVPRGSVSVPHGSVSVLTNRPAQTAFVQHLPSVRHAAVSAFCEGSTGTSLQPCSGPLRSSILQMRKLRVTEVRVTPRERQSQDRSPAVWLQNRPSARPNAEGDSLSVCCCHYAVGSREGPVQCICAPSPTKRKTNVKNSAEHLEAKMRK